MVSTELRVLCGGLAVGGAIMEQYGGELAVQIGSLVVRTASWCRGEALNGVGGARASTG